MAHRANRRDTWCDECRRTGSTGGDPAGLYDTFGWVSGATPETPIGAKRIDNRATDAEPPGPADTPDPSARRVTTHDTLTFGALNVGGVEITPNRLCHLLAGFGKMPHSISPSEFRPSTGSHLHTTRESPGIGVTTYSLAHQTPKLVWPCWSTPQFLLTRRLSAYTSQAD